MRVPHSDLHSNDDPELLYKNHLFEQLMFIEINTRREKLVDVNTAFMALSYVYGSLQSVDSFPLLNKFNCDSSGRAVFAKRINCFSQESSFQSDHRDKMTN